MNKNKGIIGLGLVLAIVLGAVVVGGGAYYLNKENTKLEVKNSENILPNNEDLGLLALENEKEKTNNQNQVKLKKFIRKNYSFYAPQEWVESSSVLSAGNKNGCELYSINYGGDGHRLGGEVSIYSNSCFNKSNPPSGPVKENTEKDGYYIVAKYDKDSGTTASEELKTKEVYKKVVETFTLNSSLNSEESVTEIFKDQPGEIKSIKEDGLNQWILSVDLLTRNTNWLPGVDSSGPFFLNQNTKIRNLKLTNQTKAYDCENKIVSNSEFVKKLQSGQNKNRYFDISGTNITAIYEQCLP